MKVEGLLGGKTRFAVLEALAEADQPLTAYQIAITKGLDISATYRCLTEFSAFQVVEREERTNQTCYRLSDKAGRAAAEFLRSLKQKTSESIDLEEWLSPEMQAKRMAKIVQLDADPSVVSASAELGEGKDINEIMTKRVPGELSALVTSSQIAFNNIFEERGGTFTLRMCDGPIGIRSKNQTQIISRIQGDKTRDRSV